MTVPLKVRATTLRKEAAVWDAQAKDIGTVASKAEELRLSRLEAGVFQVFVSAHEAAIDQVIGRCHEGRQRMDEIAAALRRVAHNYDIAEDKATALFKKLF